MIWIGLGFVLYVAVIVLAIAIVRAAGRADAVTERDRERR